MACSASSCTVWACTLSWRCMRVCSASVCSVRGCGRMACGKLACTASCGCTLTLAHGSCTSSRRWLPLCLPHFAVSPGRGTGEIHEREHANPNKEQYPLLRVPSPSSSLAYYPFSVQLALPPAVAVEYKHFNPSFGLYAPFFSRPLGVSPIQGLK